ncbi:PP2C family protein-serine/threonine phosphatase [Plantactinospora sonchi]|uniref:PP2C family protein-serine/threonine phosphatase n=1 Tax=Plantactinospora sonchi TaxID=1544735 RepID=A0ABU7S1P5_9ACTN
MVVCDPAGVVLGFSRPAARLLSGLVVGRTFVGCGLPPLAAGEQTVAGRRLRCRQVNLTVSGDARTVWYVEDVTDAVARSDALLAERGRARFLETASQVLGNQLQEDRAARAAARLAVPRLGDVAVVVLTPRQGRARWWRAVLDDDREPVVDGGSLTADQLPPAIVEAWQGGEPSEADWLADQFADLGWLAAHPPASVRVVPLPGWAGPVGGLLVVRHGLEFDSHDLELLRGFAARAGRALDAAVLYHDQAEVADTLQASLAPIDPPPVPGVQWGAAYRPAQSSLRIGGDFYGAHAQADGSALFFLGDVSGKGVDAAVFTGQLRQAVQALRRIESDPARLMSLLNGTMLETTRAHGHGRFATMVLGRAHPAPSGGLALTLASGGHLPPLVLRADGTVETVDLRGMLIGVVPDARIASVTVQLGQGETCLLFSDGVTEARGGIRGEQFGVARLVEALGGCHRMPAPALTERVEQVVSDWLSGRDHDDIAVFAIRAVSPAAPARHLRVVP